MLLLLFAYVSDVDVSRGGKMVESVISPERADRIFGLAPNVASGGHGIRGGRRVFAEQQQ